MISNRQLKILKYLYHDTKIDEDKLYKHFQVGVDNAAIKELSKSQLISVDSSRLYQPKLISLTEHGRAYFEDTRRINARFIIPLIISIVALVKSFFPELASLLQLLERAGR